MAELLAQPDVADSVADLSGDSLAWFKELLVTQGIYAQYVKERTEN